MIKGSQFLAVMRFGLTRTNFWREVPDDAALGLAIDLRRPMFRFLTVNSSAYKKEHIKYHPTDFILLPSEGLKNPLPYLCIWSVVWRLAREGEGAW